MSLKNLPLHWKIILGMFLGVLFGFIMSLFKDSFTIYLWELEDYFRNVFRGIVWFFNVKF